MTEEWRAVPDWPYEVSSAGRVRKVAGGAVRATPLSSVGYPSVHLRDGSREWTVHVHRLVGVCFLGLRLGTGAEINHKNGNKSDNGLENLEVVSRIENARHAVRHGFYRDGEKAYNAVFTNEQVAEIRRSFTGRRGEKSALARRYGVSNSVVGRVLRGVTYHPDKLP